MNHCVNRHRASVKMLPRETRANKQKCPLSQQKRETSSIQRYVSTQGESDNRAIGLDDMKNEILKIIMHRNLQSSRGFESTIRESPNGNAKNQDSERFCEQF
ncbi:hypothetical protein JTB14_025314 [Gonioctena quinquepunctata]|nr:hypothetical protein JTB14_025314 [Gonioctena quinquepunctata]